MELVYELSDGVKYNEEVARIATMAYMVVVYVYRSTITHS